MKNHKTMQSALREIKKNLAEMNRSEGRNDPKRWAVLDFGCILIGQGDSTAHREIATLQQANDYLQ